MKAVKVSIIVSMVLLGLAGCSSLEENKPAGLPKFLHRSAEKETPADPQRMAVIWSEAVYTTPGRAPTRGFGGRIYFYDDQHQSVPVAGELIVFAYDDTENGNGSNIPSRKFVYTPEQLAQHYSKTQLGHSYSVWIPWDAVGGEQTDITLVPIFRASGGQVVRAEQTKNVLPGTRAPEEAIANNGSRHDSQQGHFRQAKYERRQDSDSRDSDSGPSKPSIKSTTIPLSPSLTRQLQAGQPAMTRQNSVTQLAAIARQQARQPSPRLADVTYGQRPRGWSNSNDGSTASGGQQRQRPAFGAPGPFTGSRTNSNQRSNAGRVIDSNWPQRSNRFAPATRPAQAAQSVPPGPGHNLNPPYPVGR